MASLRRSFAYIGAFLIAMVIYTMTGLHLTFDHWIYEKLYLSAAADVTLSNRIRVIDIPYKSAATGADATQDRERLARLLDTIGGDVDARPSAIIIDLWFSNKGETAPLLASLVGLRDKNIAVYAVFNPLANNRKDANSVWNLHADSIYLTDLLKGYGHTLIGMRGQVLFYESEHLFANTGGVEHAPVIALPVLVESDVAGHEPSTGESIILPIGAPELIANITASYREGRFFNGRDSEVPVSPDLAGAFVIIGASEEDHRFDLGVPQHGPGILAWALSERLTRKDLAFVPINDLVDVLLLTLGFALLTTALLALSFKFIVPLQSTPIPLAIVAGSVSVAFLGLCAAIMFTNRLVPPIGLCSFSIITTALLGWRFAEKYWRAGVVEGTDEYDVFISYSRSVGDWVKDELYGPLVRAKRADGTPLNVYFDQKDIGLGEAFTTRYSRAIVDSKVFVPVFSVDYFKKNHCKNELDIGYRRMVDQKIVMLPLALEEAAVPETFAHLNYLHVESNESFIEELLQEIEAAARDQKAHHSR